MKFNGLRYIKQPFHITIALLVMLAVGCNTGPFAKSENSADLLALLLPAATASAPTEPEVPTVADPTFDPLPGIFTTSKYITISTTTAGADILYTTDGIDPACPSTGKNYNGNYVYLNTSVTLKAVACLDGWNDSSVVGGDYTIMSTVPAPVFTPTAGTYTTTLNVGISTFIGGATILYTTDGTDPACPSTGMVYGGTPETVASTTTIKAVACRSGWVDSSVSEATFTIPSTNPIGTVSPAAGWINTGDPIVIHFSETMDTASLVLGGTLGTANAVWSTTQLTDDTLTLTPVPAWNSGNGKTLIVDAMDPDGNPMEQMNLSFMVLVGKFIYVSSSGYDSYDGLTPSYPKRTIIDAIQTASPGDVILVAAGTYEVDSYYGYGIILKEGVSLFGGYSAGFTERDPKIHVSIINDICDFSSCVIIFGVDISPATVIDGFTMNGSSSPFSLVFMTGSTCSPTISNNVINGGNSIGGFNSVTAAISNGGSSPVIINNIINGGVGASSSYGIVNRSSSNPTIVNNIINGGGGDYTAGIYNDDSSPIIQNNIIDGGIGVYSATAIYLTVSSNPLIENNILYVTGTNWPICIREDDSGSDPVSVKNNDLFSCETALYQDNDTGEYFSTICPGGNVGNADCTVTLSTPTGSGNVSVDPLFQNPSGGDLHFQATSPCSVTQGGFDLSSTVSIDLEGNSRMAPLSMGAYEWDGLCL